MSKSKINVRKTLLMKVADSQKMGDNEKFSVMRYAWYLTEKEQRQLERVI